jgi:FlaG/FlaF family flagellin (archaellin)
MPKNYKPQVTGSSDYGVSEVIGAILLISVVIVAVAIIGVFLLSQTTPQEVPHVNFMTGTDNNNHLYLFHNGGDNLVLGNFTVIIDGAVQSTSNLTLPNGGNTWSLGQNLVISGVPSSSQHSIVLAYNTTGGGAAVVGSGSASALVSSTPIINPDVITAATYPPVVSVPQLMENVTNNSINYYRENGTYIQGYIQFNISASNSNSTIVTRSGLVQLYPLDTVRIAPDSVSQGMTVFGIGDQFWELASDNATLTITNRSSNPLPYTGIITHSWITSYKNLQSTLVLATTSGSYYTELAVNKYPSYAQSQTFSSQLINWTQSSTAVQINNVKPTTIGLFILRFDNKTKSTYFVGSASGYTYTP